MVTGRMRIATKLWVFMENSATTGFQQFLKIVGRVMAVCAAAFVIMAREGFGPKYLDALGKALFWTVIVFVPLFGINQDVLRLTAGKFLAAGLFALQLVLVEFLFERLYELNFITIASLSFCLCVIFAMAFMLIRKQRRGIWY
jgi:hypothetical protein